MWLYLLVIAALAQGVVSLRDGLRNARYARTYRKPLGPAGNVLVLCPVKGADPDLERNARSLLDQTHPDFRVVFLVDTVDDPAVTVLGPLPGAEVFVGGRSAQRGQKVHNLLMGIERFGASADIWVFADADAVFPSHWLEELIAPLSDPEVGATTGYRWYVPAPGSAASLLRSAWNATVAGFLGSHANNFAWGGSTAIRRGTFERVGVARLWQRALSDDYALTYGVRKQGLRIVYVPPCLIPAHEGCDWSGLVEFTTRQIRITRVYAPAVWRVGFVTNTVFNVTFLWLTALIVSGQWGLVLPWLALYALTVVRSEVRLRGIRGSVGHPSVDAYRWFYRCSAPLVALLYELNFLLSLLSKRIRWKGVVYMMVSPEDTRVIFPD